MVFIPHPSNWDPQLGRPPLRWPLHLHSSHIPTLTPSLTLLFTTSITPSTSSDSVLSHNVRLSVSLSPHPRNSDMWIVSVKNGGPSSSPAEFPDAPLITVFLNKQKTIHIYEPVQAFTLIWLPPWAHFRVLKNTAKTGKIMFFHTCQGTWD